MPSEPNSQPNDHIGQSLSRSRDVLLIGTLMVFGLYAGAGFLIPLALAILVFVLITAISDRVAQLSFQGWSTPQWFNNLVGVVAVLAGLFSIMFIFANQATQLARALPSYEAQLDAALLRISDMIGHNIQSTVRENLINIDMSRLAFTAFGGARSFLSTFLLICLYVLFMMLERAAITRKIMLASPDETFGTEMGQTLTTISKSLQKYLGVKTFISVLTGLFSYGVFRYLGLEFAETWGVLTFALNFIPAIGSVVAVIFPALVSLVQFESITPFLIIVFGCGTVQFLIGNFLDPALTGRSLNLSAFMVILALTFWTSIWGLIGGFLSVPLTVCILIIFSQIPALRPVAILMSKDGTLATGRDPNKTTTLADKGHMS